MSRSSLGSVVWDGISAVPRKNPRLIALLAGLLLVGYAIQQPQVLVPAALAQVDPALDPAGELPPEETLDDEPLGGRTRAAETAPKQWTWIDAFKAGGIIGGIIIVLSLIAVGLIIEHALTIRKSRIMPEPVMNDLEQLIAQGRVQEAIDYSADPRNAALATDIVLAGLERYQTSEFGYAEYKTACEEAGEDGTARLYRKIDTLNLIGVIAPMLGLLGTVAGMITAFNQLASSQTTPKPDQLAGGISQALVTTLEGLVVAIPAMVAYSLFRSQIDHLVAEAGKRVERIMAPLARRR